MEDKRIFFSYSRNDASEFALSLAEELRMLNANIWIDQLDIHGGEKWDLEIGKALKASTCVLFIVSEQSVTSDNCLDEVYYALNKRKQVIPIIICDCEVPYRIERLQRIDFIKDYKSGLNQLLKALNLNKQPVNNKDAREASQQAKDNAQQEIKQQKNIENPHSLEEVSKKRSISENKFSRTGYDYDIFISFSALDNATASNQERGWVQQFYENLQVLLAQRIGRINAVKIWWNYNKLDNSTSFDQANEDAIKRSAIMLSLVSPAYLKSNYCRQELDTFYKKAQREDLGLVVGDRSRLLNVLLYNISFKQWPPELSHTTGFPFHNAESEEDLSEPLDVKGQQYRIQIGELCDCIIKLMNGFPKSVAN